MKTVSWVKKVSKMWPIAAILGIVLLFFYPVWLERKVPLPADFVVGIYFPWLDYKWGYPAGVPVKNTMTNDVVSFIYPIQMLTIDLLRSGQLPLWNPYILAGMPLLANFQSAAFSPTNFVYFIFDKATAWSIQVGLQHLLAAVFTYWLLRLWGANTVGSVVGGVIFAFSGFNTIYSQWNGHVLVAAFLPLLLLFEEGWLLSGRLIYGIALSMVLALQVLSGYPQLVFYSAIAMGMLWIFRLPEARDKMKRTFSMGLFLLLGLGMSAFQTLPGYELVANSQRVIEPNEWVFLPWSKLITFFAPDYFGNPATGNYWGPQDYTSNIGFAGVASFILATIATLNGRRSRLLLAMIALGGVSLALAFSSPFSTTLWNSNVLGLRAASAFRALVLFNFAIAILAGFGVSHLVQTNAVRLKWSIVIPCIAIGLYTVMTLYLFLKTQGDSSALIDRISRYYIGLRNLVFPSLILLVSTLALWVYVKLKQVRPAVVLMVILVILDLFRFWWKFTPFSPRHIVFPTTPILEFLASQEKPFRVTGNAVIPINMRVPYKLESLEGYDAAYPIRIAKFIAALNSGRSDTNPMGRYGIVNNDTSWLLDLVNTRYYLAVKKDKDGSPNPSGSVPEKFDPARFRVAFEDKTVAVIESKTVVPRAAFYFDWENYSRGEEIINRFFHPEFAKDKERKLLVEGVDFSPSSAGTAEVAYREYAERESLLEVQATQPGLVFISDTWYPGWKAYLNGVETKIYRANYAFRAVFVPEGKHTVKFVYRPESFFNGLKIAGASAGILAGIATFSLVGKFRARYTRLND